MDSVMRAIGQISGSAVVAKEDLNQLRDAGLPAAAILAKMRGQTQGQFLQDVTDGAVKGTDAIRMLTEYINTQFNGAAAKAGDTLSGLTSSLRDIRSERLGQLFTPITEFLVKPLLQLAVALAQSEDASVVFGNIGQQIQNFGATVAGIGYSAFQIIRQFITAIPPEAITFGETFAKVAGILLAVKGVLVAIGIAFAIFTGVMLAILNPIFLVVGAITALYLAWQNSLFGIRELVAMAASAINSFVTGVIRAVADLYSNGASYMSAFGQAVSDAVAWVLDTIWLLPQGFADVMNAVEGYAVNIIQMFADGITAAGNLIIDALNYIGSIFEYWLAPGSPPNLLPDLTTWGTGAADAYLAGWKKADFDVLKEMSGLIEGALGSISNDALPMDQIVKIREAVASTIGDFNLTGAFDESKITAVSGPFAETMSNIARAYLATAQSANTMATAQNKLEKSTEFYTAALRPLQDRLKQIQSLQSNSGLDQEAVELNRVLQNTSATGAQKEAAKLRLEELKVQKEINTLEGQQAAESESLQTQINAAGKLNAASQEQLDILKARFAVQQEIQEGVQANVRAAIAQSNAAAAQVEKDVVGKSDAEAEKIRREAEKNADAQLALNMQMADTPGKIALLKDKLAGLTEGSTEYLEVQKQIVALEQKHEGEIEAEAKRLEREGKAAEAAALRAQKKADADAKKAAKLAPGGELALGGGASLPMPAKLDMTALTAKFEESSLKIKESFQGITDAVTPITEKLTKAKEVVDGIVKSFKDGFGGKENAAGGFSLTVENMGAKAREMDTHLKTAVGNLQKFSTDFKTAFDVADGSVTEKIDSALDATGVSAKVASFRSRVLAAIGGGGETGGKGEEQVATGFGAAFAAAWQVKPGSITAKISEGLDEAGVTTAITTFKDAVIKKFEELSASPLGATIKSQIDVVLSKLTVTGITTTLDTLRDNIVKALEGFTFESAELEKLRTNLVKALTGMEITEEDVAGIGKKIVTGIALFFGLGPLLRVGQALVTGIVTGLGGAGVTFGGIGTAIVTGIGAVLASPFLWIPIGAVIIGAIVKSVSDSFNLATAGQTGMEKGQTLLDKMSEMGTKASEMVGGFVNAAIDAIAGIDWLTASGTAGFTIGAGLVKLVAAIGKLLLEVNWGQGIKASIEFVGNVIIGLIAGLLAGLLWGLWDSVSTGGGEMVVKAIKSVFGLVTGAITGVLNVVSGIVNFFVDQINSALPEGSQIGRIPTLILDADMRITTQEAIDKARADLANAKLLAEANLNMEKTHGNIIQQFTDSGIGASIAERMSIQLGQAVESTDYTTMISGIQSKLGRQLTAADMVNLDPLLDEMNFELERIALAMSQSENAGEIVAAINEKLGTTFAATDFSGAGAALKKAIDDGMLPSAGPGEFPGLQTLLDEMGISVEAKAKEVGTKIKDAVAVGMSSATAEKHAARDDAPSVGTFDGLVKEAEAAGLQIPISLTSGVEAGKVEMLKATGQMATDLTAGIDTGLEANAATVGTGFWDAVQTAWKNTWGIQSPSTLAHDSYGLPIGEGVLLGVQTALEAVPDPLAALKLTTDLAMKLIVANTKVFGGHMKAQLTLLKVTVQQVSTEQATLMKNIYTALYRELLAKTATFRSAVVKETSQLRDEVVAIYEAMSEAIIEILDALYDYIVGLFEDIRNDSLDQLEGMKDDAVELVAQMNAAIEAELGKLPGIFETELGKVVDVLNSDTIKTAFVTAGEDLGITFLQAVADGLADTSAMADINAAAQDVVDAVETALQDALDALADATQQAAENATNPPGGTTETEQPNNGEPKTRLEQVLANLAMSQGQSSNFLNSLVGQNTGNVQAAITTGRGQELITPVNNSRQYVLQMQVTPSQVEDVRTNYAIFEAMTD
jgi:tape measure domain-containing protein